MSLPNNQALSVNEDNSTFVAFIKITIMAENKNKERGMDFVVTVVIQNSDAQLMPLAKC